MTATTQILLQIGEVRAQSGVPVKTIRYYEELGLIRSASRTSGGFRLFSPDTLIRLAFIKRSKTLGLSLQEIRDILAIHDQGELPCPEVRQTFQTKIAQIDYQIEQLTALKSQLQSLITAAPSPDALICPIIE